MMVLRMMALRLLIQVLLECIAVLAVAELKDLALGVDEDL